LEEERTKEEACEREFESFYFSYSLSLSLPFLATHPKGTAKVARAQPEQPQQHAERMPIKAATAERRSRPRTT